MTSVNKWAIKGCPDLAQWAMVKEGGIRRTNLSMTESDFYYYLDPTIKLPKVKSKYKLSFGISLPVGYRIINFKEFLTLIDKKEEVGYEVC